MSRKVADEARVRSKEANRQNNGFWKTLAKVLLGVIGGCIVFLAPFVLVIVISVRHFLPFLKAKIFTYNQVKFQFRNFLKLLIRNN